MRPVRVLLVGAGRWGSVHARTVREAGGVLAGVVDVRSEAAESLAARYGARWFAGLDEALDWREFDAAIVAVPPAALADVAEKLIREGVHVLVEKPVATRSSDALRLARLAERRGVVAIAGYLLRFHPATRFAARLAPTLGLYHFDALRAVPRPASARRWPIDLDLMVHDADLLLYLAGGGWRLAHRHSGAGLEERLYVRSGAAARLAAVDAPYKHRVVSLEGREGLLRLDYDAGRAIACKPGGCMEVAVAGEPPLTTEHRVFYTMVARVLGLGAERHPLEAAAASLRDAAEVLRLLGR